MSGLQSLTDLTVPGAVIRTHETINRNGLVARIKDFIAKKRPLKEMWYIPGSFEEYRMMIREALHAQAQGGNSPFGAVEYDWQLWLEGMLGDKPNQIVVENSHVTVDQPGPKYYIADVDFAEDGSVVFNNVEEVDLSLRVSSKNEMRLMENEAQKSESKLFIDAHDKATITPVTESRTASVEIAQIADVRNLNNRIYPKDVLKEAVEVAQKQISDKGGLLMDSRHRSVEGGQFDLRECVAVINEIEFNENTGVLSLPQITFTESDAGNDILAIFEAGGALQVSQRAYGASHEEVDDDTGSKVEIVDMLVIEGFDFLQYGDAAVKQADVTLNNESKTDDAVDDKSTAEPSEDKSSDSDPPAKKLDESKSDDDESKKSKDDSDESKSDDSDKQMNDSSRSDDSKSNQGGAGDMGGQSDNNILESPEVKQLTENYNTLSDQLKESSQLLSQYQRADELKNFKGVADTFIADRLANMPRFSDTQKDAITGMIDVPLLYEKFKKDGVVMESQDDIKSKLEPVFVAKIQEADKMAASTKLKEMGYHEDKIDLDKFTSAEGITHTRIVKENIPGEEIRMKIQNEAFEQIKLRTPEDQWIMPEDHPHMTVLQDVMEIFYKENYPLLKKLEEANGNVLQADISTRIATINAAVIPIAWRMHTAFQVTSLGTMDRRIQDIQVEKWTPSNIDEQDIADDFESLEVDEGAVIPLAGPIFPNVQIHATRQALRSRITPDVMATAMGTTLDPFVSAVRGLAMDVTNTIDRMLWWMYIIEPMMRGAVKQESWETATRVGSTNEWQSSKEVWLPYEFVQTTDANNNPTSSRLVKTTPAAGSSAAPTALTALVQGIEARTSGGTALLFNTDYSVNYPDGSITLTAAGETKRGTDDVQVKYTYNPNVPTWSIIPPDGLSLRDHLVNLRRAIGLAGVRIQEQNYYPNCVGMHIDTENLLTQGPYFTNLGATNADMLNAMNEITNYSGYDPVKSTALPKSFIPVFQKMGLYHLVQKPWTMEPTEMHHETADKYVIGQQYTGTRMPVRELALPVAITDLNTKVE